MQTRAVVTVIIPLRVMLTVQNLLNSAHLYIYFWYCLFVCNLWLLNWGQEAHDCIVGAKVAEIAQIKPLLCHYVAPIALYSYVLSVWRFYTFA